MRIPYSSEVYLNHLILLHKYPYIYYAFGRSAACVRPMPIGTKTNDNKKNSKMVEK